MALTFESRQGLSEASLTISRQAASFWHPWQEISKRLKVHKGKCGLTCRGEAFKLISSFNKVAVSRHFWRLISSDPVAVACRLIVKLVCFAGKVSAIGR